MRKLVLAAVLVVAVLTAVTGSIAAGSHSSAIAAGDWLSFGRTPENNRLSPLTEITPSNVDQLQRVYTLDFQRLDPDVRRGHQAYPLSIGGSVYVSTYSANGCLLT